MTESDFVVSFDKDFYFTFEFSDGTKIRIQSLKVEAFVKLQLKKIMEENNG